MTKVVYYPVNFRSTSLEPSFTSIFTCAPYSAFHRFCWLSLKSNSRSECTSQSPRLPFGPSPDSISALKPPGFPASVLLVQRLLCAQMPERDIYDVNRCHPLALTSLVSVLSWHLQCYLQSDRSVQGVTWPCTWPSLKLISSSSSLCSLLYQQWLLAVPWTRVRAVELGVPSARNSSPLSYWHNCRLHFLCILAWFEPSRTALFKAATLLATLATWRHILNLRQHRRLV